MNINFMKKILMEAAEEVAKKLDGRDAVNAWGALYAIKVSELADRIDTDLIESLDSQQAQAVNDYLHCVYQGMVQFFQKMGWEV